MPMARQHRQAMPSLGLGLALWQDAPANAHHRIGSQDQGAFGQGQGGFRLGKRKPCGQGARHFGLDGRFINIGRDHARGYHTKPRQQIQAAGAGARQYQRQARGIHALRVT